MLETILKWVMFTILAGVYAGYGAIIIADVRQSWWWYELKRKLRRTN